MQITLCTSNKSKTIRIEQQINRLSKPIAAPQKKVSRICGSIISWMAQRSRKIALLLVKREIPFAIANLGRIRSMVNPIIIFSHYIVACFQCVLAGLKPTGDRFAPKQCLMRDL